MVKWGKKENRTERSCTQNGFSQVREVSLCQMCAGRGTGLKLRAWILFIIVQNLYEAEDEKTPTAYSALGHGVDDDELAARTKVHGSVCVRPRVIICTLHHKEALYVFGQHLLS